MRITHFLFVLLFMAQCQSKKEPEFLLRAGHLVNEDHTWFKAFEYFSQLVEERSGGRVKVENYHSEQLAKEIECIRLIKAGVVDITLTGSTLTNWMDIVMFVEMPFLLRDSVDLKLVADGPIGQRINDEIIEKVGLRPLCYFVRGPRHLTSNRPIRHPDDLNGLIVRVPIVPAYVTAWSALGAKPTPMAFSEVFTSLQQGTIEAQENPFAMINNAGFAEVQDYVNLTSHVVSWVYPVIGEERFQSFPKDIQEIIMEAARDMQRYESELFQRDQKAVQQILKDKGMEFIEVDKDAFGAKSKDAIYASLSPEMQAVYDEIIELKRKRDEKTN
ncbi:MAG: TRAP transporter substrate-binding protein [Cyclobacteriaceae bacterium]